MTPILGLILRSLEEFIEGLCRYIRGKIRELLLHCGLFGNRALTLNPKRVDHPDPLAKVDHQLAMFSTDLRSGLWALTDHVFAAVQGSGFGV